MYLISPPPQPPIPVHLQLGMRGETTGHDVTEDSIGKLHRSDQELRVRTQGVDVGSSWSSSKQLLKSSLERQAVKASLLYVGP